MYTINVTYPGFEGTDVTETLYFHMSTRDWLKADEEMKSFGGYAGFIDSNFKENDPNPEPAKVLNVIDDVVRRSYGRRVENRFVRTEEAAAEFMDSLAYDAFLDTMIYDPDVSMNFIANVLPKGGDMDKLREQVNAKGLTPPV